MSKKSKRARQRARRYAERTTTFPEDGSAPDSPDTQSSDAGVTEAPTRRQEREEKRESARKARIEAVRQRKRARLRRRMLIFGSIAVIVALLGGFALFRYFQNRVNVQELVQEAGCSPITEHPEEGRSHLQQGQDPPEYRTNPPTSGDHAGAPAPFGVYTDTVAPERLVHSLEHGGTVVHYRPDDLTEEQIIELEEFIDNEFPNGAILNPNPDIPAPIAMAAWQNSQTCERVAIPVVRNFIKVRCNRTHEPLAECGRLGGG